MGCKGKQKKKKAPWEKEVRKPKGQPDVIILQDRSCYTWMIARLAMFKSSLLFRQANYNILNRVGLFKCFRQNMGKKVRKSQVS